MNVGGHTSTSILLACIVVHVHILELSNLYVYYMVYTLHTPLRVNMVLGLSNEWRETYIHFYITCLSCCTGSHFGYIINFWGKFILALFTSFVD